MDQELNSAIAYIGLGSNLSEPLHQIKTALSELAQAPKIRLTKHSALYRSEPLGPQDQPDYINAVAEITTQLDPHALLDTLQAIENTHNRIRTERWGARTLDLDLLLFNNQTIHSERLTVPHKEIQNRNFVLYPLHEINARISLPNGLQLTELILACPKGSLRAIQD